ncbi:MAG TPA: hypothetical protein VMC02_09540 [Steroidobacteraceae bacterium]|nr:hypothetical protein [Steroidobacteraceae bacterium]
MGLTVAGMAGCTGIRVSDQPPPNYSIAGVWELNAALSSDADKVLAALQPKPRPGALAEKGVAGPATVIINDPTTDLPPADASRGGRGRGGGMFAAGAQNDRNAYRPPIDFQTNALLGGQWLIIRQTDTEVRIANAATTRSYTPGEHSVVSVPSGVADQDSGWSGRDFRVYLKPQIGPSVEETYTLPADGKHLTVTIRVGSEGRNQAIKVIRVYDRSAKDPASFRQTLEETLPPTD